MSIICRSDYTFKKQLILYLYRQTQPKRGINIGISQTIIGHLWSKFYRDSTSVRRSIKHRNWKINFFDNFWKKQNKIYVAKERNFTAKKYRLSIKRIHPNCLNCTILVQESLKKPGKVGACPMLICVSGV